MDSNICLLTLYFSVYTMRSVKTDEQRVKMYWQPWSLYCSALNKTANTHYDSHPHIYADTATDSGQVSFSSHAYILLCRHILCKIQVFRSLQKHYTCISFSLAKTVKNTLIKMLLNPGKTDSSFLLLQQKTLPHVIILIQ